MFAYRPQTQQQHVAMPLRLLLKDKQNLFGGRSLSCACKAYSTDLWSGQPTEDPHPADTDQCSTQPTLRPAVVVNRCQQQPSSTWKREVRIAPMRRAAMTRKRRNNGSSAVSLTEPPVIDAGETTLWRWRRR